MNANRTLSIRLAAGMLALMVGAGEARGVLAQEQDAKARGLVRVATQTELDCSRDDHSRWEYKDVYRGMDGEKVFRVVETGNGSLKKKVEENGRPLTPEELKQEDARLEGFVNDPAQQAKQRKDNNQDDKRAESMLRMLPDAFLWKVNSDDGKTVTLGFEPNPEFQPPTMESRVFAAMAGEIVVDKEQHRIKTIRGELTDDVKFGWGLFGRMK
jgi:hypothetical protein